MSESVPNVPPLSAEGAVSPGVTHLPRFARRGRESPVLAPSAVSSTWSRTTIHHHSEPWSARSDFGLKADVVAELDGLAAATPGSPSARSSTSAMRLSSRGSRSWFRLEPFRSSAEPRGVLGSADLLIRRNLRNVAPTVLRELVREVQTSRISHQRDGKGSGGGRHSRRVGPPGCHRVHIQRRLDRGPPRNRGTENDPEQHRSTRPTCRRDPRP